MPQRAAMESRMASTQVLQDTAIPRSGEYPERVAAPALTAAERRTRMRQRLFAGLGGVVLIIALSVAAYWYFVSSHYASTDNAYVDASTAQITPRIEGTLISVPAYDTQHVKTGDILAVVDPTDAKIAVAQAQANFAQAQQHVAQYFANVDAAAAMVNARRGDLTRAQMDYKRRDSLASTGAVSGDEMTTASNDLQTAQSGLSQAVNQLASQRALIAGTDAAHNPEVLAAKAALDKAKLDLERTVIRAPIGGVVAQNTAQVGQHVAPGAPLMSVVPVAQAYVNANFKESQLARVHIGQPVTLTSDLYGSSVVFHGTVVGLGGGTGAAFSVIPAQNATGNWIKVVQRLPVRIALDPKELAAHPLRVGLSMNAEIKIAD
jgi:membrane fusion protein (multidrug efflux system)